MHFRRFFWNKKKKNILKIKHTIKVTREKVVITEEEQNCAIKAY